MGDLTNQQIDQTYDGLIHTATDQPIDGTLVNLQDGLGNNLPMQVSNTTVNFTGTVTGTPNDNTTYDLSAFENNPDAEIRLTGSDASVDSVVLQAGTNINMSTVGNTINIDAADTNTTYDFGVAGAAGNINFALTGSDATNDVVVMQAGTNITLTDNGSNTFTIDAAGGGGGATQMTFSPGTKVSWVGPPGQDTIVWEVLIPANTVTGAGQMEFYAPVFEGSEGQWIYTSWGIGPNQGQTNFSYLNVFGQQTISGGGDPYSWYRLLNIYDNGTVAYKDHNNYSWPTSGGDPIQEVTNIDWTIDQYFQGYCWADASNAKWDVFNPTLTIIQ